MKIGALLMVVTAASNLLAAEASGWSNLETLRRGDRIGVIQANQKRIEGRFEQFSDSSMTLRDGANVTIPKEDVVRVYKRARLGRKTRILIGGAIGLIAGAITFSTVGDRFRNETGDFSAAESTAWVGGSAGLGVGIGALTGGGYKTIYQVTKLPLVSGLWRTTRNP